MTDMFGWTTKEKSEYIAILKDMAQHKRLSNDRLEGLPENVSNALIEVCKDTIVKKHQDKQPTFVEKLHKWVSW